MTKHFRRMSGRVFLKAANDSLPKLELGEDPELTIWEALSYVIHRALQANPSLPLLGARTAQEIPFDSFR